jgi:hypothetical protein
MAETDAQRRAREQRRRDKEAAGLKSKEADVKIAASESEARKAEAEARAAEARAKSAAEAAAAEAQAEAAKAKGRADELIAQAQLAKLKTDQAEAEAVRQAERDRRAAAEQRAADAAPWQIGATAAALPAGIGAGVALSKVIEKRHLASVNVANAQLAMVAQDARKVVDASAKTGRVSAMNKAKLTGIVNSVDKLKLGKMAGPLGVTTAALLVAEAAMIRFGLAPQLQDERAKAVVGSVATASVFAASNLVGERLIQNATLKALPAARDIAAIETARKLLPNAPPAAAPSATAQTVAKLAPAVGKVVARALPVAAVAFALYEGVKGYQKDGVAGAATGIADSMTFGLVSAGRAYLDDGAKNKAMASASQPVSAPSTSGPAGAGGGSGKVYVEGYTRSDGSKVDGHWRQRD